MIKLIVGLGNPGQQYDKTRHNAGFLFLDGLASERGSVWVKGACPQALFAEFKVAGERVMLLKPQAFMNRSGQVVGQVARYYRFNVDEILVVHDEMDFDIGIIRLKKDGGHAGHNGLKDIISHLGAKDFYRLRIGVGRPVDKGELVNYVLSVPSRQDSQELNLAIDRGLGYIDQIVVGDMVGMNKFNV